MRGVHAALHTVVPCRHCRHLSAIGVGADHGAKTIKTSPGHSGFSSTGRRVLNIFGNSHWQHSDVSPSYQHIISYNHIPIIYCIYIYFIYHYIPIIFSSYLFWFWISLSGSPPGWFAIPCRCEVHLLLHLGPSQRMLARMVLGPSACHIQANRSLGEHRSVQTIYKLL